MTVYLSVNGEPGRGLPGDDPGFTRGMNAFETFRRYGSTAFRVDAHLRRLVGSCAAMGLPAPDLQALRQECAHIPGEDLWIRVTLTLGGNRVIQAAPIDQARVGRPLSLRSVVMPPTPGLPGFVKHGSRASWVLAAQHLGCDEIVMTDNDGRMLEANRSNVFAVKAGSLVTPPCDGDNLEGVTRGALLDAARARGLVVREEVLHIDDSFDELYVCSTLKELAPVSTFNGRSVGGGPVGKRLYDAFGQLVARECGLV